LHPFGILFPHIQNLSSPYTCWGVKQSGIVQIVPQLGYSEVQFPAEATAFLFSKMSRPSLVLT